ncbi:MAG TPA: S8 family peptidase [Longimicrobiaceae bacterium]|nr:S8 family peptidase [Longimicrobiaceae bacterium]
MRYAVLVLLAMALLAACSDRSALEPTAPRTATGAAASAEARAKDSYIVVLKPGANPRALAAAVGANPRFVYQAALNGFAATLNAGQLNGLRHNPHVSWIEPDQVVRATTIQTGAPEALDRIDQRALPRNGTYTYTSTASDVNVYVIDSGIYTQHPEFEGRAVNTGFDAIGGSNPGGDCSGHGTHVAGSIGARTYGVAKKVRLLGVRVLNCDSIPKGLISGVIAGVDWVTANHKPPAVANLSLGAPASAALDSAVNRLADQRVFVAVAAGNQSTDACTVSPARARNAYAVAGVKTNDERYGFSNWGPCVDIYAPGTAVVSTWNDGTVRALDGTSMAAPHVAGVAALYKATNPNVTTNVIHGWLRSNATVDAVIKGSINSTPNYLLYKAGL